MAQRFFSYIKSFFDVDRDERLKVLLLSVAFFLVIGAYTLTYELKDSLFVHIVGKEYVPYARMISMLVFIPAILLFSKLVDLVRKHQLLYLYMFAYGFVGLIIAYYLGHPTIGLVNTVADKHRIFGWLIYLFAEGYPPFIASLLWAFINSITSPDAAKKNYSVIIAGSKLGGITVSAFAIWLLTRNAGTHELSYSHVVAHQILFSIASFLLFLVPIVIYILMKKVPSRNLHGYEAAYEAEKKGLDVDQNQGTCARLFSGLTLLVRYPYVLGMFGMIFFWEVVNSVIAFERLGVGKQVAHNISDYTRFLFDAIIYFHFICLLIVVFGTRFIIKYLGERRSLILVPVATGVLLISYLFIKTPGMIIAIFVLLRAINYAFANPLRESLYIPTSKDMRFKAKSWIDAFGAKFAKAFGSSYNVFIQTVPLGLVGGIGAAFFLTIISFWTLTAHLLGRRFEKAINNNEVIGLDKV